MSKLEQVYGLHAVTSLLNHNAAAVTVIYAQAGRRDKRIQSILDKAAHAGIAVEECSRQELDQRCPHVHQGIVAMSQASTREYHEQDLDALLDNLDHPPFLLILDGVTDPHNLGACLRSADAAGVTAVIFPKDKSADVNDVARKVASGAAEAVPWVRVTNLARTIESLQQAGVWVIGTDGDAETTLYDQDLTGPCALVLGSEGSGMRRLTRERCDFVVRLPMSGSVSSLNVSVAAGVCLFEAVRQRAQRTK